MTLDEFFAKLEKTPRDWRVLESEYGQVRRPQMTKPPENGINDRECPVCSLHPTKRMYAHAAAHEIGLSAKDAMQIIRAADNYESGERRQRLLKACGLA